jgi:hypothetical protein
MIAGAVLGSLVGWVTRRAAAAGLASVTGILGSSLKAVGLLLEALAEIVVSLARSPEGRVVLVIVLIGAGSLYVRHHYLEQGRAEGYAQAKQEINRTQTLKPVRR